MVLGFVVPTAPAVSLLPCVGAGFLLSLARTGDISVFDEAPVGFGVSDLGTRLQDQKLSLPPGKVLMRC